MAARGFERDGVESVVKRKACEIGLRWLLDRDGGWLTTAWRANPSMETR